MTRDEIEAQLRLAAALQHEEPFYGQELIRRLAAALESLTAWRPMETAPRDGTFIIAIWEQYKPEPLYHITRYVDGGWIGAAKSFPPTAWLPLVPPPQVK